MAQKKNPIGVENFEEIIENGYLYIDKTKYIKELTSKGKFYFLSRPRRFGKSLLLSTIKAYFEGKKHLFEGLAIADYPHDWEPCPVFHLNFVNFNTEGIDGIKSTINQHLHYWEKQYKVTENDYDFPQRFYAVIRRAVELTGKKAVVLVDEYDKALISSLGTERKELHNQFRAILKPLYGTLKAADEYIQFGFLTGVTRFSKLNIFSDINNLRDISLSNEYPAICGITEEEMLRNCRPGIDKFSQTLNISFAEAVEELKMNYDGYHFTQYCPDIYNPFSLFSALEDRDCRSYWFATGTPTFLMNSIRNLDYYLPDFNNLKANEAELSSSEVYNDNPVPMLFQTGYLTIKSYNRARKTYSLRIPNLEVEEGLFRNLLPSFSGKKTFYCTRAIDTFLDSVEEGKPEMFIEELKAFLAAIPYYLSANKPEIYYENNIYIILKLMGYAVHTEYHTSEGRIDILITTEHFVYVIELKLNGTAEEALHQIESKHYPIQFKSDHRILFKIGISFSKETRNIDNWIIK